MDVIEQAGGLGAELADKVNGNQAYELLWYLITIGAIAYVAVRVVPPVMECCRLWSRDRKELELQRRALDKKETRTRTRLERKRAEERSESDGH